MDVDKFASSALDSFGDDNQSKFTFVAVLGGSVAAAAWLLGAPHGVLWGAVLVALVGVAAVITHGLRARGKHRELRKRQRDSAREMWRRFQRLPQRAQEFVQAAESEGSLEVSCRNFEADMLARNLVDQGMLRCVRQSDSWVVVIGGGYIYAPTAAVQRMFEYAAEQQARQRPAPAPLAAGTTANPLRSRLSDVTP